MGSYNEATGRYERNCIHCGAPVPEDRGRSQYCCDTHRASYSKRKKKIRKEAAFKRTLPEHVKAMKELMRNEDIPLDVIREVYQEQVRENISQHVSDTILGVTEILSDMAPKALAGLLKDLESNDPMDRQRAYMIWFKYVMPLAKEKGAGPDLGKLTVVHEVPVPDTILGERFVDEMNTPTVTPPDIEMLECYKCHEIKHQAIMQIHDNHNGKPRYICQSCFARKRYAQVSPSAIGTGLRGLELTEDLI